MLSCFSCVQLFATLGTVACQAPLSVGFSRQEYWSGLPRPPLSDLPNPGIEPRSPILQGDSLPSQPPGIPSPGIEPTSSALAGGFFTAKPPGKPWEKGAIEKTNFRKVLFLNRWICCYLETEYIHCFFTIIWETSFEKHKLSNFEKWFWLIVIWLDHMGE